MGQVFLGLLNLQWKEFLDLGHAECHVLLVCLNVKVSLCSRAQFGWLNSVVRPANTQSS